MVENAGGGVVLLETVAAANGSFSLGVRAERRGAMGAGGVVSMGVRLCQRCVRR